MCKSGDLSSIPRSRGLRKELASESWSLTSTIAGIATFQGAHPEYARMNTRTTGDFKNNKDFQKATTQCCTARRGKLPLPSGITLGLLTRSDRGALSIADTEGGGGTVTEPSPE